jgi:hypothetical protein
MPTVETQHREEAPRKPFKDRATRRALMPRHRVGIMQAAGSARIRSGIRTGTTPHFRLWMADLQLKSALQRTKTEVLADHDATPPLAASAYALMFIDGIRNVFQLTQVTAERLLSIDGIGPKKLAAVEQHLLENNVKPSWTAK